MASIALYANKINCMPGLVKDVRGSVMDLKSELVSLKRKSQSINRNICNLDDVISSISASTQIQEKKMDSLSSLGEDVRQFASDADKIDGIVADKINKNKEDFYDKYYYLKPDCEKNLLEKVWNDCKAGLKSVGEWCREHWKFVVTVVLVAAAVLVLAGAFGPVGAAIAWGAKGLITGALTGGIVGGIASEATGGTFFEGFEDGAFDGAISGMITGGMGISESIAVEVGVTLLGDIGDIVIKGENLSIFEVIFNAGVTVGIGLIPGIKIQGVTKGRGSWKHVWATQSSRSLKYGTSMRLKTILKGIGAETVEKSVELLQKIFENNIDNWKETWIDNINFNKREYLT